MSGPRSKPSLRTRLARHVILPLVLTWALGSAIATAVANHFAGIAYDRALLEDARALAAHMVLEPAGLRLALSPQEIKTLLFDQAETIYFTVIAADGLILTGNEALDPASIPEGSTFEFSNFWRGGRELNGVTIQRTQPAPFQIVVAKTSATRTRLLQRLLAYSALPQLFLLLFLAWWLRRVIQRDLNPLAQLQQAVDQRHVSDLAPMPGAVAEDATTRDVERLGVAVNSLLSRLAQSVDAQREFAGNVAHELRTPLAGIRAQASYALGQPNPEVWREQLRSIAAGEERASHLVDQLLALARADEARAGLEFEDLALNELARDVLLRFLPKADAAGVDLGGEGLDEPVHVRGVAALVEGIITNLLDNALRYGSAQHPHVTVALERHGPEVLLCVIDNGPGLDRQEADRIAGRWAQGTAGQKLGAGAGLGLAIVHRYAQLLGAGFTLERGSEGLGLRATIRFHAAHLATIPS